VDSNAYIWHWDLTPEDPKEGKGTAGKFVHMWCSLRSAAQLGAPVGPDFFELTREDDVVYQVLRYPQSARRQ
jgi:hypothetical protein